MSRITTNRRAVIQRNHPLVGRNCDTFNNSNNRKNRNSANAMNRSWTTNSTDSIGSQSRVNNAVPENRVKVVVSVEQTLYDVVDLLEERLGLHLAGCQFYLQDRIKVSELIVCRGNQPVVSPTVAR